jgi:hypothetical protein
MESELGPTTISLARVDGGSRLFWLRGSVIDSWAVRRVTSRPAVTAVVAAAALTTGCSKSPA